jgi:outer membrane protein OmpA-like peptidoglycan-associated protein
LEEIAGILQKNSDWKLSITGHTDNIGGDASNLELSRKRAAAVKTALVERYHIAAARLASGGMGASQPQAKNDTPEGRARNRRVELTRQ